MNGGEHGFHDPLFSQAITGIGAVASLLVERHELDAHDGDLVCGEIRLDLLGYIAYRLDMAPEAFADEETLRLLMERVEFHGQGDEETPS